MRTLLVMLIGLVLFSCKRKKECTFSTVADLDKADFKECPPTPKGDSTFIYMRQFSGGYDSMRKAKGIPALPKDYMVEVFTVDNQVRWHSEMNDDRYFKTGKPYLKWKDLEWSKDTLKYDRSIFTEGKKEHPSNNLIIVYYLDTLTSRKDYLFRYEYSPKNDTADVVLTKPQADSVLKAWGLKQ
jgi:hypothetical protein